MKHAPLHKPPHAWFFLLLSLLVLADSSPASSAAKEPAARLSPDALVGPDTVATKKPLTEETDTISVARLRQSPPADARADFSAAWEAFQDNDFDRVIHKLKKALDIYPNYVDAHNNLGYAYWIQGRLPEAISEFQKAISLDPTWSTALTNLALADYQQGRRDEARTLVERALQSDPASSRAHYAAGAILLNSQTHNAEALEHLRKADDEFPRARLMEAYLMLRLNHPNQAQEELRTYLMRTPLR